MANVNCSKVTEYQGYREVLHLHAAGKEKFVKKQSEAFLDFMKQDGEENYEAETEISIENEEDAEQEQSEAQKIAVESNEHLI